MNGLDKHSVARWFGVSEPLIEAKFHRRPVPNERGHLPLLL